MKTIYLVVEQNWEDTFPLKAFANKEAAETFAAAEKEDALKGPERQTGDSCWDISVEEIEFCE